MTAMQSPGPIDPITMPRAIPARADGRIELVGLSGNQLRDALLAADMAPAQAKLRAKQIWHWMYNRGVTDFAAMTDIAKDMREMLSARFAVGRPEVVLAQQSIDGTRKWLLRAE